MKTDERVSTLVNRVDRERAYHNELYQAPVPREVCEKFQVIAQKSKEFYWEKIKSLATNARVLEYGCGVYTGAFELAKYGAHTTGIDISDVAVKLAVNQAAVLGLQQQADFLQMNAEELLFPDDSFDLIFGSGILHHVNLGKAFNEIRRTLKPRGTAVFIEPLAHNWFINLYRRLTPQHRSPDERALSVAEIQTSAQYFERAELFFYHLASLACIPFVNRGVFNQMLDFLDGVDEAIFRRLPSFRRFAWQVVIVLSQPRKHPA